jgi:hypothetical protein
VRVAFLTPAGGLLALTAVATLAIYFGRERRAGRVRTVLGLELRTRSSRLALAASLALVPLLLGLAAAQPVIESVRERSERSDAELLVALDSSRSMLASTQPGAPTRIERAAALVDWLSQSLPEIPIGLAAFDGTMLPYVLPTTDGRVLATSLTDSLEIERAAVLSGPVAPRQTTSLEALGSIPRGNYFTPSVRKRLLVVLTDGETNEVSARLVRSFQREPQIQTVFVRFWGGDERVYTGGVPEPAYEPDPESAALLERIASAIGARVHDEDDRGSVLAATSRALGSGPTNERRVEGQRLALMPYVTLAALFPLALLLWRRNI